MIEMENGQAVHPEVSVVMPAYNAEKYIAEAISSVVGQTFQNWELLVLDDCSQDRTCAIVEQFAADDCRIRLIRNDANQGVANTRNRGLDLCSGDYVALLDSDDRWYPQKLEQQVKLAKETSADVVYCSYGIVDEQGVNSCNDFIVPAATDFEAFLTRSVISCSTALLSRKIMDTYRFDKTYYHEDLALWLQILRDGYTARGVTEVLADYRVMAGTRASNKLKVALHRWEIYRDLLGFSVFKSIKLILQYALLGLMKYKKQ